MRWPRRIFPSFQPPAAAGPATAKSWGAAPMAKRFTPRNGRASRLTPNWAVTCRAMHPTASASSPARRLQGTGSKIVSSSTRSPTALTWRRPCDRPRGNSGSGRRARTGAHWSGHGCRSGSTITIPAAPVSKRLLSPFRLGEHLLHDIAGNREPDADIAGASLARARIEQCGVDADQLAVKADQSAAGVARIDRRIGLDEAARISLPERTVGRADDAAG